MLAQIYTEALLRYVFFAFQAVFGVERNYLESAYTKFFIKASTSAQFQYPRTISRPSVDDVVRSLYDDAGKRKLTKERKKQQKT